MATVLAVVLVGGVLVAGLGLAASRPELPWLIADRSGLSSVTGVLRGSVRPVTAALGRIPGAVFVYLLGIGSVMMILWPFGVLARGSQPLDDKVFAWAQNHTTDGLTALMDILTQMGNRPVTKPVTIVAIVVLFLIRRERRWVVPAVFLTMFLTEFFFQNILEHAIHRADPPTASGNYPSGGCARVVLTYGLIIFFLLRERRRGGGQAPFAWYSVLAAAGVLEAFSRTYLLKHWVSDTVGGLLFGVVLLGMGAAMATILDGSGRLLGRDIAIEPNPGPAGVGSVPEAGVRAPLSANDS